jgi:hypothetical protein
MSIIPMGNNNNEEFNINNLNDDAPRASPTEMAKDMLDANKLMRAFLRTMSRDSKRVGWGRGIGLAHLSAKTFHSWPSYGHWN